MDKLNRQAKAYAGASLAYAEIRHPKVYALVAAAYKQGWVDRDTRDMKPETEEEFFNGE